MSHRRAMKRGFQVGTLYLGGVAIALADWQRSDRLRQQRRNGNGRHERRRGGHHRQRRHRRRSGHRPATPAPAAARRHGRDRRHRPAPAAPAAASACRNDFIEVAADITTNTTWACNTYVLKQKIHIDGGATDRDADHRGRVDGLRRRGPDQPRGADLDAERPAGRRRHADGADHVHVLRSGRAAACRATRSRASSCSATACSTTAPASATATPPRRRATRPATSQRVIEGIPADRSRGASTAARDNTLELRRAPLRAHPVRRLHHRRQQRAQRPDARRLRLADASSATSRSTAASTTASRSSAAP